MQKLARFFIMDDLHGESMGEFDTFADAKTAIIAFTTNSWDEPPNRAPCQNWENCGREYHIREFGDTKDLIRDVLVCKIRRSGIVWIDE